MYIIVRKHGKYIEITKYEKKPEGRKKGKVRLPDTGEESDRIYGPKRSDSLARTRKTCLRSMCAALEEFGNPLMVTLTFEGDATDAAYANDALRKFFVRLRDEFENPQCIFVPELSDRGRIHFHGFLFNVPLSLGDSVKGGRRLADGRERKERILADIWREGFVDAVKTDGSTAMANYLSKYITQTKETVLFNAMRLIRKTRGIPNGKRYEGEDARKIAEKYEDKKPWNKWSEDDTEFLGDVEYIEYFDELLDEDEKDDNNKE